MHPNSMRTFEKSKGLSRSDQLAPGLRPWSILSSMLKISLGILASLGSGSMSELAYATTNTAAAPAVCAAQSSEDEGTDRAKSVDRFWDLSAPSLEGREVDFATFQGQVALVVNTASRCGHTHQYEGLQRIFKKYKSRGFVVLGFPSNDFAGQEPGTNAEIKSFCQLKYGVDFPMFAKAPVKGEAQQEVFRYLTSRDLPAEKFLNSARDPSSATAESREVAWNFEKFLIDRDGQLIARARSRVQPEDPRLIAAIEAALKQKPPKKNPKQSAKSAGSKSSKTKSEVPCQPE
ncbi:MAG TPA: glutathione peroxidase [Pseudobdellovibrionaceae bacterium]|nr:glutathione peroxidase [Pseudobdellovibrionaceae bacterium]